LLVSQVKLKPDKSKCYEKGKKVHRKIRDRKLKNIKFSSSKLERMKRLAQLLSKQIATLNTQGEFWCFFKYFVTFSPKQKAFYYSLLLMI
jgi:hypothetical protein